jgi:hypothetical protein
MADAVAGFIATLDGDERAIVGRLRALALAARPGVTEHIKWNAPSFCVDGDDRVTLGIERKGGVRAVLHRGAKVKDATGFAFADADKLATWPSADRGVLTFKTEADLVAVEPKVADLFARWLAATV